MSSADAAALIEQRWNMFYHWGPCSLLGFSLLMAAATSDVIGMTRGDWYVVGALTGAGLALQLWPGAAARSRPQPSPATAIHYALRWAIGFVLTWINPFFAFYAVVGYFGAERLLPARLVKPGLFFTAVTMSGSQSGGLPPDGELGWGVFGGLLAVNVALLIVLAHLAAQEEQRARDAAATIIELERTNAALQQAMDENAALHTQLLLQAREAGVADERRRLAAEIHDTIAQGLTGIIAQLQVVENAQETGDRALAGEHLGRAADLARHSLGEARRSVHNLSPSPLEHDRLPEALKKTVAEWAERTGIRADLTVTGTAEHLHGEIEATLLRIVQEAVSNTARHAHATRLGVTLSFMGDEVTLDVRDDGRGFDPLAAVERTGSGGFGLDGMRARAERVAGSLTVESEPGGGTAVSARVPLVRHEP
ncbi:sensor histidine kinase [Streptomyces kanamyceticus]|uniref:sensor histidine kinase n=1 Tax=Streptomyces kanamyceticus TaxID=1967 RepID=UPI0037DC5E5A